MARRDPLYRKITADEFLAMDFNSDRRFELDDGVIVMMAGGTKAHSLVQGNVLSWLRTRLRGSGCRPHGPNMALRISETQVRYPDVAVYCGEAARQDGEAATALGQPTLIVEVLSAGTQTSDQGTKLEEYAKLEEHKAIPSVRTVAFVDPVNRLCRTVERVEQGWLDAIFSGTRGIPVPALDLHIPHDEVFAED